MRKVYYCCLGIGMLISLYVFIFLSDVWKFANIFFIYLLLSIAIKKRANEKVEKRITFFTLWVTIYYIIYLILININGFDLLDVDWRYMVQFFIPWILVTIPDMVTTRKQP